MSDVITDEERHEAATEEPINGAAVVRALPVKLPGGFDGVEQEKDLEELKRRGAKLKECNDRSYAKMNEIARIANECIQRTTHADYSPGQYGEDYRAFGKAMGEIRKLVGPGLAGRFGVAPADGVYYTPDWLAKLAKEIEAHDKPIDPTAKEMERGKGRLFKRKHNTSCHGTYVYDRICINDAHIRADLHSDDGGLKTVGRVWNGGRIFAYVTFYRTGNVVADYVMRGMMAGLAKRMVYHNKNLKKRKAKLAAAKALAGKPASTGQEVAR